LRHGATILRRTQNDKSGDGFDLARSALLISPSANRHSTIGNRSFDGKLVRKLPPEFLKELVRELTAALGPRLLAALDTSPGSRLKASLPPSLATKLSARLGTKLFQKLSSKLISRLLLGPLPEPTRWLLHGLLPMWGVDLRLMRLTR